MSTVIDFASRPSKEEETETEGLDLQAVMERNKKNKERVERERASNNNSVLSSYRIRRKK